MFLEYFFFYEIRILTYKSKGIFLHKYFSKLSLALIPVLEIDVTMHKKLTQAKKAVSSIPYSKVIELNSYCIQFKVNLIT